MKLREIYDKSIDREINPAVAVSNKKKETIDAEIQEYIFTDELIGKLYTLLDTVANKKTGKTGIWINGYYGSGKSHFIKFAHYCLDKTNSEAAFSHFAKAVENYDTIMAGDKVPITSSNLQLLRKKIQASHFEDIMFNVGDVNSDVKGERLTRVFLNMFNKFRGYNGNDIPLAILLEKYLDKKGLLVEFHKLIKSEMNYEWALDATKVASFELERVLKIAKSLAPDLDVVSLHSKLTNPDSFEISIEATLIPELQEFIKSKDDNYRLLFLVDEISQYINTNKELLLNLQSIIERVSEDCNNKVWIACTAQQSLDEVSTGIEGITDVQDEFGKILGRFDTRISLQSNDASYITQKRVLDKNSNGIAKLNEIYEKNSDYILNQFKISHELYKGYQEFEDFQLSYPFVPYQFRLIAHVFEAFQQLQFVIKEVKNNERSVLGITHFTAKQNADNEVGGFIPFDAFYNQQFHTNLTHRGYKAIENGLELQYVKELPFAKRVVKTLFMISNLLESQRQTFPSNIDNLTVLMMDKLDQNKMKLQNEIKDVLNKLVDENIIREEKGNYYFFNEDEMDVQNLIKNQVLGFEDKLVRFENIFTKISGIRNKVAYGQNDFRVGYSIDGKEIFRGGDFEIKVLLADNTPIANKAMGFNRLDLGICINEWFNKDETLRKDFDWYCKTLKFFQNSGSASTGERAKTIDNFRIRNSALEDSIQYRLKQSFAETRFISQQQIIEADQVNGSAPADRVKNLIEKHLAGIYKNHLLAGSYAQNQTDLKKFAASTQVLLPQLSPAEQLVNDLISNHNNQMTVHDLINEFAKPPFGWRHEAVLDILVNLVKKKKREFFYNNNPRFPIVDFINKAVNTKDRMVCEVRSSEEIDQATLNEVMISFKEIFNHEIRTSTDGNELFETLLMELKKQVGIYAPFEEDYLGAYPFGKCFHEAVKWLTDCLETRDPKKLFNDFNKGKNQAKELIDTAKGMAEFVKQSVKDYDAIKKFHESNIENFKELTPDYQEKAEKITGFLKLDDPRREYRHVRKAYDELKQALKEYTSALIEEVTKMYEDIFLELENKAKELNISDANIYAGKEHTIEKIREIKSIAQLNNKKLGANDFKSQQITSIIQYAAKQEKKPGVKSQVGEPEVYYITNVKSTISNIEELDKYLAQAREEMMKLLEAHKTIIIK